MKYLLCLLLLLFPVPSYAFSWQEQVARLARDHHVNENLVVAISDCEAHFQPFVKGPINKDLTVDIGAMQINSSHWDFFKRRGLDVVGDPIDNIEAGIWLIEQHGTSDYSASRSCWQPKLNKTQYLALN